METRPRISKAGNLVANVAATTPITLYQVTTGKTAILKRLLGFNGQGANVLLEIGTGLAPFVRRLPRIQLIAGTHENLGELDIPQVEFSADITMQVSAAGAAPADVQIVCEVEEIG